MSWRAISNATRPKATPSSPSPSRFGQAFARSLVVAGAGVANLGCGSYCRAWIFSSTDGPVYAHEFGHNLRMHHASTDPENDGNINSEYGDLSDPEGSISGGWRGHNAPHKYQMSWLDPASAPTVVSSGIYDIYPLALDPLLAGGPQALVISKPDTNELYFVSYRRPIGVDAGISSSYIGGASIHRYHGSSAVQTKLIKVLGDGGTFDDPINGVTVTQLGRAWDNSYVTVAVDFGCASSNPTVNISPSSAAVGPGEGSTHTVSVTNNDGPSCAATTFDLVDTYDPGISGLLSISQLSLSPGDTDTATLQLTVGTADGTYTAAVEAVDLDGLEPDHSVVSATATVFVDATAPTAPTNLTSSLSGPGGTQVDLTWDPASDSGSGLAYYAVYRDAGSGFVEVGQSSAEGYTDSSANSETTYTYEVSAVDLAANESTPSNQTTATTGKKKGKGKYKDGGSGGGGGDSGPSWTCLTKPNHPSC